MQLNPASPFPYYVLTGDQATLPRKGEFYIFARNGIFFHKGSVNPIDPGLIESTTKVEREDCPKAILQAFDALTKGDLQDCQAYAGIKLVSMPHDIALTCQMFFARVFGQYRAEAELQIYYSPARQEYRLVCPKQEVSGAAVRYELESSILDGEYRRAGTIHSHCDFSAFHSGTDTADEEYEDGLHITFGHVNGPANGLPMSIVSTVVSNGSRFPLNPTDVIEGIADSQPEGQSNERKGRVYSDHFYRMTPGDAALVERINQQIDEWMPNVRPMSFGFKKGGKNVRTNY